MMKIWVTRVALGLATIVVAVLIFKVWSDLQVRNLYPVVYQRQHIVLLGVNIAGDAKLVRQQDALFLETELGNFPIEVAGRISDNCVGQQVRYYAKFDKILWWKSIRDFDFIVLPGHTIKENEMCFPMG